MFKFSKKSLRKPSLILRKGIEILLEMYVRENLTLFRRLILKGHHLQHKDLGLPDHINELIPRLNN